MNSNKSFDTLYSYVNSHPHGVYELTFSDNITITATFDTAYETDNDLDIDNPNYEEFWAMLFLSGERAIEITYKNTPIHASCGGDKIY